MIRKLRDAVVLALAAGTLLGFGGCLGGINTRTLVTSGLVYTGLEFVLDNGGVFDLFADGPAATADGG
jgi:hypothetical protein